MADESQDQPSASQAAEAASGAGSSTSSPYTAGKGPGFDERQTPPGPPEDERPGTEAFLEAWEEDQVRDWLRNAGALAHAGFGVGEHDWEMTKSDIDRIAPPATRILNRYQPTRAVAAFSDPAAVAIGFGLYGWRSTTERIAVLREREKQAPVDASPIVSGPLASVPGPQGVPQQWVEQLRATRPPDEEETP